MCMPCRFRRKDNLWKLKELQTPKEEDILMNVYINKNSNTFVCTSRGINIKGPLKDTNTQVLVLLECEHNHNSMYSYTNEPWRLKR